MKLSDYFAPLDDEHEKIIAYEPDPEPICRACRKDRHEYCVRQQGSECWCEEEHEN